MTKQDDNDEILNTISLALTNSLNGTKNETLLESVGDIMKGILYEPENRGSKNSEIMSLVNQRLELGKQRYGHGVRVDDDTRTYGTPDNNWDQMAIEEILDCLVYLSASIIREKKLNVA